MEEVSLIKKVIIDEKTRNKTEYVLTDKGLKTNRILYELSSYAINELDSDILDTNFSKKLDEYYKEVLKI